MGCKGEVVDRRCHDYLWPRGRRADHAYLPRVAQWYSLPPRAPPPPSPLLGPEGGRFFPLSCRLQFLASLSRGGCLVSAVEGLGRLGSLSTGGEGNEIEVAGLLGSFRNKTWAGGGEWNLIFSSVPLALELGCREGIWGNGWSAQGSCERNSDTWAQVRGEKIASRLVPKRCMGVGSAWHPSLSSLVGSRP